MEEKKEPDLQCTIASQTSKYMMLLYLHVKQNISHQPKIIYNNNNNNVDSRGEIHSFVSAVDFAFVLLLFTCEERYRRQILSFT